jgi:putative ABC transport system permease protein
MIQLYLHDALRNLWAYRLRSFLAMLGVLVGTASVVALVASGQLATQHVMAQFAELGTQIMGVSVVYPKDARPAERLGFQQQDLSAFRQAHPGIEAMAAYAVASQKVQVEGQSIADQVVGVSGQFAAILSLQLQQGRPLTALDSFQQRCVLGLKPAHRLKEIGIFLPLEKEIEINNSSCMVVAVLQKTPRNFFIFADLNRAVLMPLSSLLHMRPKTQVDHLLLKLRHGTSAAGLQPALRRWIVRRLGMPVQVRFESAEMFIKQMRQQQQTLTTLLGLIGGIALLVGGIGVMNIMLVSVVARRREIGVRMAVGASPWDIKQLFLCESAVLTVIGGLLGVVVGVMASYLIAVFEHWEFTFFAVPPMIGFLVSVLVGIVFGYYPALQATKGVPAAAIRAD